MWIPLISRIHISLFKASSIWSIFDSVRLWLIEIGPEDVEAKHTFIPCIDYTVNDTVIHTVIHTVNYTVKHTMQKTYSEKYSGFFRGKYSGLYSKL